MIPSSTGTKDLQTVDIALRILYRPKEEKLYNILNEIGADYDKKILPSIGNEVLKSVVALYNAEQLISER
jgi:prohibitin 1